MNTIEGVVLGLPDVVMVDAAREVNVADDQPAFAALPGRRRERCPPNYFLQAMYLGRAAASQHRPIGKKHAGGQLFGELELVSEPQIPGMALTRADAIAKDRQTNCAGQIS